MGDWLTILLMVVAVLTAAGLAFVIGADWGYKRGWRYGEAQARTRTLRHMRVLQDALDRFGAPTPKPLPDTPVPHDPDPAHVTGLGVLR